MNTRFEYLYRDGSNYKMWGAVVFSGIATASMRSRLKKALESAELFIAHQVRIPELFFTDSIDIDDHCFHEFSDVVECDEPTDDAHGRTFEAFVAEVERAARDGWKAFDPADRALKSTGCAVASVTLPGQAVPASAVSISRGSSMRRNQDEG